jgi:hypothetical protein
MLVHPDSRLPTPVAGHLLSLPTYDIVHFVQEAIFDEIVGLAARIFSLPISLFNLVDVHYVHTQAQYGMPHALATSQPLSDTLCADVVAQNQVLIYHDLTTVSQTARFASSLPATRAQNIRFYAAAPLRLPKKHSIGTLCLLDYLPREFKPQDQRLLECLADLLSKIVTVRYWCRTSPLTGASQWTTLHTELHAEIQVIGALVRYLLLRYGRVTPLPEDVVQLIIQRLRGMYYLLQNYGKPLM